MVFSEQADRQASCVADEGTQLLPSKRTGSTFSQTFFNCLSMLIGIGLLSCPLAFALSGWTMATTLILGYAYISCRSAKVLGRIVLADPDMRCYSDVAKKAFGPRSSPVLSALFCVELFTVSVLLVTLYADSLHSIYPRLSPQAYKLGSLVFLLPTAFLSLPILSYCSISGLLSTVLIIWAILFDGWSKTSAPGSLWDPAPTSLEFRSWKSLGVAFGLFIAGFGCHPVIPSLARDMREPHRFEGMLDLSFAVATFIYGVVATAGYLMFGNEVSGEISLDLLRTPGYNEMVNHLALWMLVVSPLTKYSLTTQPLISSLEIFMGIDDDDAKQSKRAQRALQKICVVGLSISVSILVPGFTDVMAFLGCSSAFMLCIIGPLMANMVLSGRYGLLDCGLVAVSMVMAVWGTIAIFV
uniref:Amino acid transporter transmembrane domain-containing protein n=1 Tax=Mycena chlorophos TaxID=658473 RepID=A0ABQ0LGY1_MYCCL|nr:predicted protein [Mycena chlorophos]